MKLKTGDVLTYRDSEGSARYGTGVVTSITSDEYFILWSGRGLTKYRRAILDDRLDEILQRSEKEKRLPKERHLKLGGAKAIITFNDNYDRVKVETLCDELRASGARKAKEVADGLVVELFTKKLALRGAAKYVLFQLAELCNGRNSASDGAQNISKELFFGYVIRESDFAVAESKK